MIKYLQLVNRYHKLPVGLIALLDNRQTYALEGGGWGRGGGDGRCDWLAAGNDTQHDWNG